MPTKKSSEKSTKVVKSKSRRREYHIHGSISKGDIGISASKIVALIGTLIVVKESIALFNQPKALHIFGGIIGLLIAVVLFLSFGIIEIDRLDIPYEWRSLLIIGLILLVFSIALEGSYIGSVMILLACCIEGIIPGKSMTASELVVLVGAAWAILKSISLLLGGDMGILYGIIGIIVSSLLILSLNIFNINFYVPFEWWVVLIFGFIIYTWIDSMGGTIILTGFILVLMAY
ncbi:MAG: hypothetical protein GF364_17605 [Candidatus Lokiarchaeota archaeon]|nr:hypothetical protein [Candidatus Lokiarchaeota archaeon]